MDARQGVLRVRLPRLELDGFNRTFTGSSLRTGRVTLTDLDIVASFSDRGYDRPVGARAGMGALSVSDVVYASDGLPGGLLGLSRFGLSTLAFRAGATGQENVTEPGRHGWVGIPIIDPLIHLLHNVISFYGGLPFRLSVLAAQWPRPPDRPRRQTDLDPVGVRPCLLGGVTVTGVGTGNRPGELVVDGLLVAGAVTVAGAVPAGRAWAWWSCGTARSVRRRPGSPSSPATTGPGWWCTAA